MIKNNNKDQGVMTAHPSKYPQRRFKTKPCGWCDTPFMPQGPSHRFCSDACKNKAHSDKYYRRNYGLGLDAFFAMLDRQGWACAICKTYGFKMREDHISGLNVDHCHKTGRVRGLLCHNCNRGLGLFQDNPTFLKDAITYLGETDDLRGNEKAASCGTSCTDQENQNPSQTSEGY